jgi:co-chaperonin GroES (HSP10)
MNNQATLLPIPFRPNGSAVLLKHLDITEETRGGLVIPKPNLAAHQTVRAQVVAVGKENTNCEVGDVVMVHQKVGNAILLEGIGFVVARPEDIVGFYL